MSDDEPSKAKGYLVLLIWIVIFSCIVAWMYSQRIEEIDIEIKREGYTTLTKQEILDACGYDNQEVYFPKYFTWNDNEEYVIENHESFKIESSNRICEVKITRLASPKIIIQVYYLDKIIVQNNIIYVDKKSFSPDDLDVKAYYINNSGEDIILDYEITSDRLRDGSTKYSIISKVNENNSYTFDFIVSTHN